MSIVLERHVLRFDLKESREIQTQKGSKERLFIFTRTHSMCVHFGNPERFSVREMSP